MENEVKKKGDDGELVSILIVLGGVFSLTLLAVDVFYGNMQGLFHSWLKWPFVTLHVLAFALWVVVIRTKNNPNLEWCRWALTFTLIASLLVVMAHRSGWIGEKQFQEEVDKNKQETLQHAN